MYFKWKDEYNTGIKEIDDQHRRLFEIGGRIYDLANANDAYDHYDEIMAVLEELKAYTVYHFGYEEKLMERFGYEHYETHKFQHYFAVRKIQKFEEEDVDENQSEIIMKIVAFISDWISNHILKEDMKYKDLFISKGVR
ncbi:MAG: bacteriohemerythrin [Acetivibrionales bacterium]|jgi:hemerythrin